MNRFLYILIFLLLPLFLSPVIFAGATVLNAGNGLWDNMLSSDNQSNQGTATASVFYVGHSCLALVGFEGLDAICGADTRDSAVIKFRSVADYYDAGTVDLYGVWKWQTTEAGSEWGDWKPTAGAWGTDGCNSANDAGSFNTTNNGGDDRTATPINTGSWVEDDWIEILDDEWFPASGDSIIWALKASVGADGTMAMTENVTYPLIVTIYTTAAGGGESQSTRRRKVLLGGK